VSDVTVGLLEVTKTNSLRSNKVSDVTVGFLEVAKTYGLHAGFLLAATYLLWGELDDQWQVREQEIKVLHTQITEERNYIRTKLTEVVERNTEALIDLKTEVAKSR
jgi:hypothetical protein